jgi:hypothetical protein
MVGAPRSWRACGRSRPSPAGTAVALINGEAGIGKTRLVAELVGTSTPALPVLASAHSISANCSI